MLRYSFALLAACLWAAPTLAGSWAEGMFDEYSKDFGSVPHGQILTHPFTLKNTTGQTVTISNVRVSCGLCTSATALTGELRPGEETSVVARMDSGKFYGLKTVYIYVTFSQPQYDEVRLWIQANSRDDVNLTPDTLAFGRVARGSAPSHSTTITFYGDLSSQITGVQAESNYVQPKVGPARQGTNEISYDLTVKLRADTPVGKWFTDVWVKTSNPAIPRVRVPLTIEIEPALTINTTTVSLGQVKVGETAERKLVVRGTTPFKITALKGTDDLLQVKDNTSGSNELHILTIRLKGGKAGEVSRKILVLTDLKDEGEIEFVAHGQVVP